MEYIMRKGTETFKEGDLKANLEKTKQLVISEKAEDLRINYKLIQSCRNYKYLRACISTNDGSTNKTNDRIILARQ